MRLFDFLKPRGKTSPTNALEQAATIATTPSPRFDEYWGGWVNPTASIFALDGPTPAHIEWLYGLSDEWARVCVRLRMEVWRQGLLIEPIHPLFCATCGEGIDDEKEACPGCNATGTAVAPDPMERSKLKDLLSEANKTYREGLITVGEKKTESGLKHGRSYVIFKVDYTLDEEHRIVSSAVKGVYPGNSARIIRLVPNTTFICIWCRTQQAQMYKPETRPGRCKSCGVGYLYEAWYAQSRDIEGGSPTNNAEWYWLHEEVHETRWPYTDGSSPIARLWPKASTLLMMDWYAAWALDPKKDKRPDKWLVTMGGDLTSLLSQLKTNAELRKKNPYAIAHIHIPSPPGGLGENKLGAEVLDFADTEFKGQMLELRQEFEAAIRKHYGLSSLTAGDDQEGGLGQNDAPKVRTTAQVAESIQKAELEWLLRLTKKLGCKQWTYKFPPTLEEDGTAAAEELLKWLEVAEKASSLNLHVEWRADKPHIQDGEVKAPAPPPNPFSDGSEGEPGTKTGFAKDGDGDDGDAEEPNFLSQAELVEIQEAIASNRDLTVNVKTSLGSAAGFNVIEDEAFTEYAGLTPAQAEEVRGEILASLRQPTWSTDSIVRRIAPIWERAGLDPAAAAARAATVARTEVRSIASEFKKRAYQAEEAERGETYRYHIRGANDHRTTKLSYWTRQQIPRDGLPLTDLEAILDEGVMRAIRGDFTETGTLRGTHGQPIHLPPNFKRRGFLIHFNDRDQVYRVV